METTDAAGPVGSDSSIKLVDFGVVVGAAKEGFETARISLALAAGEAVFLVGGIGTGKSLLTQALAGLLPPGAQKVGSAGPHAFSVALAPQDPRLVVLPTDTLTTLRRGAEFDNAPSPLGSFLELLAELHVDADRLKHVPFLDYSASERRRVLLALAFRARPSLLVIDGAEETLSAVEEASLLLLLNKYRSAGTRFLLTGRRLPHNLPGQWTTRSLDESRSGAHAVPLTRLRRAGIDENPRRPNLLELRSVSVVPGGERGGRSKTRFEAVRGVSFYLREGASLALLGPSGSGKSLLLEAIFGIGGQRSGRILFGGHDVPSALTSTQHFRKEMQLVFQDAAAVLDGQKTVRKHLLDAFKVAGESPDALETWLSRLDLPPRLLHLPADALSAGEAARVALARSLIPKPRLLLLDAPRTLGLASDGGALLAVLEQERARGMALLVATNDPSAALSLCDQVAMVIAGSIAEIGPTRSVLEAPVHPATRDYLAKLRLIGAAGPRTRGCPYTPQCSERDLGYCSESRPRLDALTVGDSDRRRVACHFPLGSLRPSRPASSGRARGLPSSEDSMEPAVIVGTAPVLDVE